MSLQSAIQLLGGVGLFLFAIKLISDSLQLLAGDRMRQLIGLFTKTPLLGVLVGTGVTVLIQSSSATTVMTVSFVDAGLMTLKQAIGVIMGANIGTTITGQIIAIKIKDYAYIFIIIGVLLSFLGKSKRSSYIGNGLLGFGLLFVGMQTMETSMAFLHDRHDIFLKFSETPLMGLLAGALLTLLVQSSSATVGLTIALGMQGLLPIEAAVPIILGDNIGTTITAMLASISTGRTAKQACAAHVFFNIIGVCIFLPLMPLYLGFIKATSPDIGHQIANAHTLFNVCNTILFLPFVGIFAKVICRLIPSGTSTVISETRFLDSRLLEVAPVMGVEAVKNECIHMGSITLELIEKAQQLFFQDQVQWKERVIALEDTLDALHKAIRHYAEAILQVGISKDAAFSLKEYVTCSGNLERIGDTGKQMLQFYEYRQSMDRDFSPDAMQELQAMFAEASEAVTLAIQGFNNPNAAPAPGEVDAITARVRMLEAELRAAHMHRLSQGVCDPDTGSVYIDVLGIIERMAYRAKKIDHTKTR